MVTRQHELTTRPTVMATVSSPGSSPLTIVRVLMRMMEARDPRLRGHGIRTAHYALALGRACGLSEGDLRDLSYAGKLHDIGRLTLPDAILHKDGPLSAEEYALVQCHPRAGAEFLASFSFLEQAALWIAHHHERWDGAGYPFGLRGTMIPTGSRILAVADTFDALILDRPRGQIVTIDQALQMLQITAGSHLDPELVAIFGDRVPELIRHLDRSSLEHDRMECNGAGSVTCSIGRSSSRSSDPGCPFSTSAGARN